MVCAPRSQSSTTNARAPATDGGATLSLVRPRARAVSPRARHSSSRRLSRTRLRTRAISVSYSTGLVRKSSAPDFQPAQPLAWFAERGDHDDRDVQGGRIVLQPAAALEAVHPRHHHVEQDEVRLPVKRHAQRVEAVLGAGDLIVFGRQLGLQQSGIGRHIVDDQDPGGHRRRLRPLLAWGGVGVPRIHRISLTDGCSFKMPGRARVGQRDTELPLCAKFSLDLIFTRSNI